jgi:hypothetical protein
MKEGYTPLAVYLPVPEAGDLIAIAVRNGCEVAEYLGYLVLRSAYGALHPVVAEFEASQRGTPLGSKG